MHARRTLQPLTTSALEVTETMKSNHSPHESEEECDPYDERLHQPQNKRTFPSEPLMSSTNSSASTSTLSSEQAKAKESWVSVKPSAEKETALQHVEIQEFIIIDKHEASLTHNSTIAKEVEDLKVTVAKLETLMIKIATKLN